MPSKLIKAYIKATLILCGLALGAMTPAQANPFASGWQLQSEGSSLKFQSIKNNTKLETSSFATMTGNVNEQGAAELKILLDSVDTKIDLRNVRMRFLFFETFQYPEATVNLQLDPAILEALPSARRKIATVPYSLDLHGVKADLESELTFTQISDDLISVTTNDPIVLAVDKFNLNGGLTKLMEAANVSILPSTNVTFDLLFARNSGKTVAAVTAPAKPESAALETQGNFSEEACKGRFEIMSRTDNIYFKFGSALLDPKSQLILDSIIDIIQRCPGMTIEVAGHTDSDGANESNQVLSEARANSVKAYIVSKNVQGQRIVTRGYGESQPVVPNDTPANKRRNRRIEFLVL